MIRFCWKSASETPTPTDMRSKMCCPAFSCLYASSTIWLADACKTYSGTRDKPYHLNWSFIVMGFLVCTKIVQRPCQRVFLCCFAHWDFSVLHLRPHLLSVTLLLCESNWPTLHFCVHSHGNKQGDRVTSILESFSSTCCGAPSESTSAVRAIGISRLWSIEHSQHLPEKSTAQDRWSHWSSSLDPNEPMFFWPSSWTNRISSLILEAHQTNLPQTWLTCRLQTRHIQERATSIYGK